MQPTTLCNLDCTYCYLPHRAHDRRMALAVAAPLGCQGRAPEEGSAPAVNPLAPSGQTVVLRGTASSSSATPGALTVSLMSSPPVATSVAADGSFTLTDLPSGPSALCVHVHQYAVAS